jgi:hypothetical protein
MHVSCSPPKQERPGLTIAALTIVKAYFETGRPSQPEVKPLGSFEPSVRLNKRTETALDGPAGACPRWSKMEQTSKRVYSGVRGLTEKFSAV